MPSTIYGNFPILLPGLTQSMSRNGLMKTSGTIICRPGQESEAYSMAQEYGSVFPDIATQKTETGLIQVTFDAYQEKGAPTSAFGSLALTLSKSFTGPISSNATSETTWSVIETWVVDTFTVFRTSPSSANSFSIGTGMPLLNRSMKQRRTIGRVGSGGSGSLNISWLTELSTISRRNFGYIDEIDLTYSQSPTLL